MLDHAEEAVALAAGIPRDQMDRKSNLALAHLIEIVGEAANRVPKDFQQRFPDVPWSDATGMRNKLAHGYDLVDYGIVWDTAHKEMPSLIAKLRNVLKHAGKK